MVRFYFILFVLLLIIGYVYFDSLNPGSINLILSKDVSYELRIPTLILLSISTGALIVLVLAFIKGCEGYPCNMEGQQAAEEGGKNTGGL